MLVMANAKQQVGFQQSLTGYVVLNVMEQGTYLGDRLSFVFLAGSKRDLISSLGPCNQMLVLPNGVIGSG